MPVLITSPNPQKFSLKLKFLSKSVEYQLQHNWQLSQSNQYVSYPVLSCERAEYLWCDLGESVWSRTCDILFSIWLKCLLGEVHFAENPTRIGSVEVMSSWRILKTKENNVPDCWLIPLDCNTFYFIFCMRK